MKFKNLILVGAMAFAAALDATAQTSFNLFSEPRTLALVYPQAVNAGTSSNFCTDIHGFEGIAKVDIITLTNGACSAGTLTIYTSPDRTNFTALPNFAFATSNNVIYTNLYWPQNQLATNIVMYAGTKVTPNAATAGFATSYITPAPFTSTGAISLSNGLQTIGFSIPDNARYIQFAYSFTGSSTNTIAAILTARRQQE